MTSPTFPWPKKSIVSPKSAYTLVCGLVTLSIVLAKRQWDRVGMTQFMKIADLIPWF